MDDKTQPGARPPSPAPSRLPSPVLAHLGRQLRMAFEAEAECPSSARLDALVAALRGGEAPLPETPPAAEALREALIEAIPALRAFAFSLTYDADRSDDLVQDTLMRAWSKAHTFTPGTHLIAWLFTILRNHFYSEQRKRKREVEDVDDTHASRLITLPDHEIRLELADFRDALGILPVAQREALMLIGAQGLSYEEAAKVCGTAVGTIKSRVNRARTTLVARLGMDGTADIGSRGGMRLAAIGEGP